MASGAASCFGAVLHEIPKVVQMQAIKKNLFMLCIQVNIGDAYLLLPGRSQLIDFYAFHFHISAFAEKFQVIKSVHGDKTTG